MKATEETREELALWIDRYAIAERILEELKYQSELDENEGLEPVVSPTLVDAKDVWLDVLENTLVDGIVLSVEWLVEKRSKV